MEEDENGGRREMIRDITIGQYYPQSSVIHRLDPRVKLLGTVLFVISVFLIHSVPERVKIHFYDYSLNLLFQPFSDAGRQFI